jgi:hypothetical protein
VLSKTIEAVSDKSTANIKVAALADELYKGFNHSGNRNRPTLLNYMITVEQTALDVKDLLTQYGLYTYDRWLPYLYESILPGGGLMLRRPTTFEEFCDDLPWAESVADFYPEV